MVRIVVERLLRLGASREARRVLFELGELLFEGTNVVEVLLHPQLVGSAETLGERRLSLGSMIGSSPGSTNDPPKTRSNSAAGLYSGGLVWPEAAYESELSLRSTATSMDLNRV